jgi:hypothetical protein
MPVKPIHLGIFASLIAATSACSSSDEEEFDCLGLGGGYEGEDLEALQAECEADSLGTYCDASAFIESDVAKCLSRGEWSERVDRDSSAGLFYSFSDRTVLWSIDYPDEGTARFVHATTGEFMGLIWYQAP